jgi:aspartyl-tRNA(Asn)/glutamyl-tRNA(Gln) amidotransferase subunit A
MTRRRCCKTLAASVVAASATPIGSPLEALATESRSSDEVAGISLTEAAHQLRAGKITSTALTQACLDRILIYNPMIDAYITVLAEWPLAQAARMDAEQKTGRFRSQQSV